MSLHASPPGAAAELSRSAGQWAAGWWRTVRLVALLLALVLSPSSYAGDSRRALARRLYLDTAPTLLWFTVLSTLISVVLIRIVLVTALSYGLTQYALEMVVRVLVLELIPLTAALFAALRCTLPAASELAARRAQVAGPAAGAAGVAALRSELLPRVGAGIFCALMLAVVNCVVSFIVAYLSVYGFTSAGFAAYTNTVGHIFSTSVSLILGLKILFMSLTVALLPAASALDPGAAGPTPMSAEARGLVRLFAIILLIEAASLVGNYY